jgi:hypothetical protein
LKNAPASPQPHHRPRCYATENHAFMDGHELGTRTATLDRAGIRKLRANWIYRSP